MGLNFNLNNLVKKIATKAMTRDGGTAIKITKIEADARAISLVSNFLTALAITDEQQRLQALMPLLHKSLLFTGQQGVTLAKSVNDFMYQRALQNFSVYQNPVQITEVHQGQNMTVGFQETAETGRQDKYFIAKKDGVAGRPAPVIIFWPASGEAPKIINFGSL